MLYSLHSTLYQIRMKRLQKAEEIMASQPMVLNTSLESPAKSKTTPSTATAPTPSPQKLSTKTENTASNSPNSAGPKSTPKKVDPQVTEALRVDRDARALNLSLEFALQFTLRREAAVDSVVYIGDDSSSVTLLNASNISDLICRRLTEQEMSAVQYLTGCFKRIVAKESSASQSVAEDLIK